MAATQIIDAGWSESVEQQGETQEWLEALEDVLISRGPIRCEQLLRALGDRARDHGVRVNYPLNSAYLNTVSVNDQPDYPGDIEIERRITGMIRWNAIA